MIYQALVPGCGLLELPVDSYRSNKRCQLCRICSNYLVALVSNNVTHILENRHIRNCIAVLKSNQFSFWMVASSVIVLAMQCVVCIHDCQTSWWRRFQGNSKLDLQTASDMQNDYMEAWLAGGWSCTKPSICSPSNDTLFLHLRKIGLSETVIGWVECSLNFFFRK